MAKIDADMVLEKRYFEKILDAFCEDERLGITGGVLINESTSGGVRGGNRVFRKECWSDISDNGYMPIITPEDTYLSVKAQYKGWKVKVVRDAKTIHLRPLKTTSLLNKLKRRIDAGYASYSIGYHPLLFLGRLAKLTIFDYPPLVTAMPMVWGWIFAWIKKETIDPELKTYLRRLQRNRVAEVCSGLMR
mgnify:CR=1 FL=1